MLFIKCIIVSSDVSVCVFTDELFYLSYQSVYVCVYIFGSNSIQIHEIITEGKHTCQESTEHIVFVI